VLLDNQATRSVFIEPSLLTNVHNSNQPFTFIGIGGSKTSNLPFAAITDNMIADIMTKPLTRFMVGVPSVHAALGIEPDNRF
jgi:hypothetical protein